MVNKRSILLIRLILILSVLLLAGVQEKSCAGAVILEPVTIREGLESQISLDWPLENKNRVYSSKNFKEKQALAEKSGIDLKKKMSKLGISRFNKDNGNFFMLFYNQAKAPSCRREFLVQRIKLTKSYYNSDGKEYKRTHEYLVELFKIDEKSIRKADEHFRSYDLNEAYRRIVTVTAEIGCGVVRKKIEGRKWPYSRGSLYRQVQPYSESYGLYRDVKYDFSREYSFEVDFNREGIKRIRWPDFLK